ncbi:MAG TPA: esterase-like activity of phytase family protein, partial [Urbifossiella sp.]
SLRGCGIGSLPGTQSDLSGLTTKSVDGTPRNRLGGLGSAVAYTGKGHTYLLASDRGPNDGVTDYICRFHTMEIAVTPGAKPSVALKLTATTLLTNEAGKPFVGSMSKFNANSPSKTMRLDPEGLRVGPKGTLFISDEYGPFLYEFDRKGKRLRSLPVPRRFLPNQAGEKPEEELPPRNLSGRQPNRGMEGLALSPDGGKLFGLMQGPLLQDGALDKVNKRIGVNTRLLELETATGKTREFVYQLESPATGVSEILAINDREFLVLERDGLGGKDAKIKKIHRINLTNASDVSAVKCLPSTGLPAGIVPVEKRLFIDLLAPKFGLARDIPEKLEGLAFGPDLPDGRRLLIVTADNDFVATVPFRVFAFAIDRSNLPGFVPQR